MSLSRAAIDALMPPGTLWTPEDNNYLDALLDGIGSNIERWRKFVHTLAYIRDPLRTTLLSDLEKEFGIIPDITISETVRRQRLLAVKTDGSSTGTYTWLQNQLHVAGFTSVNVYENSPAVNPNQFLQFNNDVIFGGLKAWTVNDTSASAYYNIYQTVTVLPSTAYTLTLWIKKQVTLTNSAQISVQSGSNSAYFNAVVFNPQTGSLVTQSGQNAFDSTTSVTDGDFWKVSLTFTSLAADNSKTIYFNPAANTNGSSTLTVSTTGSQVVYEFELKQGSGNTNLLLQSNSLTTSPWISSGTGTTVQNADGGPFPVEFGNDTAREFVSPGGQLLVNGPIYDNQVLVQYGCPTDPGYWPMIFFVGGTATRDSSGAITALTWAQVPIIRKTEFIRYIIKYKPMFTWACVLVEYV